MAPFDFKAFEKTAFCMQVGLVGGSEAYSEPSRTTWNLLLIYSEWFQWVFLMINVKLFVVI